MKKLILLSLVAMFATIQIQAQVGRYGYGRRPSSVRSRSAYLRDNPLVRPRKTEVYYGLRLGLNVSTVISDDRYLDGSSAKTGFNVGIAVGFQAAPASPVFIESGLYYSEKGGKGNYNGAFTYQMNYLEVPLLMKYRIDIDYDTNIQPFLGVYGAVGISGKIKDFNNRQAYGSFDDDAFQRFDGGLRLGCGIQFFSSLYAEIGCNIGLANIGHDYFGATHNSCFFATIGVNF